MKRLEHLYKGFKDNRQQISPIPPVPYGERFLNFMAGITMSKEEAERRTKEEGKQSTDVNAHNAAHHHHIPSGNRSRSQSNADHLIDGTTMPRSPRNEVAVEETLYAAEKSADKQTDSRKGRKRSEEEKPDRTLLTAESGPRLSATLPVVSEDKEGSSRHGSHRSSRNEEQLNENDNAKDGPADPYRTNETHEVSSDTPQKHTTPHDRHFVEYEVTSKDSTNKEPEHVLAPMDSGEQLPPSTLMDDIVDEPEAIGTSATRIPSKPPRIESGIVPKLDGQPLLDDADIGLAR